MNDALYLYTQILSVNYETLHVLPAEFQTHKLQSRGEHYYSAVKEWREGLVEFSLVDVRLVSLSNTL